MLEKQRRSPLRAATARAWIRVTMRGLLRHARRSDGRRRAREESAARVEALPSTFDIVAACAVRQELAETVMGLEEPYRSSLLYLYFEDLDVRAIAHRMDVSEETVRQRLVRGRAKVRAALERRSGGSALSGLLPLFPPPARSEQPSRRPWFVPLIAASLVASLIVLGPKGREIAAEPVFEETAPRTAYDTSPSSRPVLDDRGRPLWDITRIEPPAEPVRFAHVLDLSGWFDLLLGSVDDEEQLAQDLGVEINSLEPVELDADPALELWRANVDNDEGEAFDGFIARAALGAPFSGARMVAVFQATGVYRMTAVGTSELDEDRHFRWNAFLSQLINVANAIEASEPVLSTYDVETRLARFEDIAAEDAALAYAIQRLVMTMRNNRQFGRAWSQLEPLQRTVPAAWLADLENNMRELAKAAPTFDPVLGPDDYVLLGERASTVADSFAALKDVPENDVTAFGTVQRDMRGVCNACHRDWSEEAGASWMRSFAPWSETLELPNGALRVGVDLAPALGDDGAKSEALATSFRSMLGTWKAHR